MRNLLWSLVAAAALLLTSCLDIVEEVTLNKDGSGKYQMSMDMSEMMQMMMTYMPDSIKETMDEKDMMDSLATMSNSQEMDSVVEVLEAIEGISNAENRMEGFVMIISYDFTNIESLNLASSQGAFTAKQGIKPASYTWKKGRFGRTYNTAELGGDDETEEAMAMAKMMMQDATFTTVYNFPGKVKKFSNEDAQLENGKRTIRLTTSFGEILDDPALMSNEIQFKSK